MLSIEDRGIGISEEDQAHLFERFFRARNAVNIQGTGLGLNIILRYIELMNGSIEYKSELEKGSVFTIHIPQ
ncbi:sensor histidine kinase [Niabella sp. W65]|nr:sensor histidine kinase [Niabella sp. W65]MCH7361786.1 sensor histidine kinase [Niabella sp. W65]